MSNQTTQYDPLADYLDDLKPSDENAAGWLELRYDFARAEQIIDQALAMLPREPGAEAGCFPKGIHDAATALYSRFEKVMTYGPECHGFSYPQAARLIPEVEESKVSNAAIFALIAICEAREAGEKMAGLIEDYAAMNNEAARAIWNHERRATTARLSIADGFLNQAHDSERIEREKGRAAVIERTANAEKAKQRKGLPDGPKKRSEKAATRNAAIRAIAIDANTWEAKTLEKKIRALATTETNVSGVIFTEATESECHWETTNENGGFSGKFKWSSFSAMLTGIKGEAGIS